MPCPYMSKETVDQIVLHRHGLVEKRSGEEMFVSVALRNNVADAMCFLTCERLG